MGAGSWFATELEADGDTLFGLADHGFASLEPGSFSLSELASLRLPFGMGLGRDILFEAAFLLSVYAEAARGRGEKFYFFRILYRTLANSRVAPGSA